jgi:hypothetical protein
MVTLVIVALVFVGTSLISGSKSLASGPCGGPSFCIQSPTTGPVLYPGVTTPSNLPLTFTNPLSVGINVYSLTIAISVAPTSTTTSAPGCDLSTMKVTVPGSTPNSGSGPSVTIGYTGGSPYSSFLSIPAGSTVNYNVTLALADNHQNQDACEGLPLTLTYNASAYRTDSTSSVLSSSQNPSTASQAITLTDTVTDTVTATNTPAGSVLFYSCTSTTVASCSATALGAAVNLSASGVAAATTTPATGGTYYYEAVYTPSTGSTNFTASTSNILTKTVSATAGSKVFLWSTDDETVVGFPVTYVADVLGPFFFTNLSATGTMTFTDNGVAIPSCVNVPVFFGVAICSATYQTTLHSPHVIVATYNGDAHHGTGTSNTVSETVYRATPTNKVTNTSPATLGGTLKFTATVSGPGVTPTGPVTWKVSGTVTSCTTSTTSLVSDLATCTITTTKAGSYSVSDAYGGDTNYTSAGSNTDTVSVAKATPTNVVTNSTPPALGGNVTFTATVTGVSGITPTGSVTWKVTGSAGVTSCTTFTTTLASGVATCSITASKAGTYIVSDTYGGDANYTSVASNTDTVTLSTPKTNHLSVIGSTQS